MTVAPGLALIFDMDGVILDSNPLHRQAWEDFNRRFGLDTTEAMQERMYGRRNDDIVRDFFGDGLSTQEIAARGAAKEELYREMLGARIEEVLVPGIRDFLERQRDAPMGLASNAESRNIDFLLERAGLASYFRVVVHGDQVRKPKPDPEIYLRTSALLGIAPADCIVFEDSHSGVAAACAAGMRVVGLSTTYVNLPGSTITVDNFCSEYLIKWLSAQKPRAT